MKTQKKAMTVTGWVIAALIGGLMLFSATFKFLSPPGFIEQFTNGMGYPKESLLWIAIAEAGCAILYLIPRTAVLGAIIMTGYLGGAIATTVRVRQDFIMTVFIGVLVWGAIYLRDPRVRELIPLRRRLTGAPDGAQN